MKHLVIAFALMVAGAQPVLAAKAQKVVPAALDPNMGYVLVRLGERSPGLWNILTLSAYDEKAEDVRGKGRAKANPVATGADRDVFIAPKAHIAEANNVRTYLTALAPGRYVISASPTTCFCLGSYQFDVTPGVVTDMGTIFMGPENGTSSWAALSRLRSSADIEDRAYTVADAVAVYPKVAAMKTPPELSGFQINAAVYLPARGFGNHLGRLLNKALPLAGGK